MLSILITFIMFMMLNSFVVQGFALMQPKTQPYGLMGRIFYYTLICCLVAFALINVIAATAALMQVMFSPDSYSVMEFWGLFIENYKEWL